MESDVYLGKLACQGEEKDEVGRKTREQRERETEWDKIEARWADERWGCQASGRAAEADSDVVVEGRGREEVRRNNG